MPKGDIHTDVVALEKALLWRGLDLVAPKVEYLSTAEIRALKERDFEALTDKVVQMFQRDIWEQGADPEYLSDRSYGFAIQHKARERLLKYLFPVERLAPDVQTAKPMGEGELLSLLRELRTDPESTQQRALPSETQSNPPE